MARLLFAALLIVATSLGAHAERRVALVMGADDYRLLRPLDNAVNDALAIEEALRGLGFEVFLETNRDLRRMRRALEDFEEDADGADVALVFFAGHGVEIEGENRLLPVDADAASLDALKETSLTLEEVRATVARVGRVGLIVLDACRDDPFGLSSGGGRGAAALQERVVEMVASGLGRMGRSENVLYAFSAAPGETASDGAAGNSPFTTALARYLGAEGLEIRSVLTLVQQEVYDATAGAQLPYVESGLPRLFFASASPRDLPERERLLLAMAEVTPDLRAEVERIAAEAGMPLAPLFGTLISLGGEAGGAERRSQALEEAARAFVAVREEMNALASSDPQVADLRASAESALSLGEFDKARSLLDAAVEVDRASGDMLRERFVERRLSEAATHFLKGGAAAARLERAQAAGDYAEAAALYREVEALGLTPEARHRRAETLERLGAMQVALGDVAAAAATYGEMLRTAEGDVAALGNDMEARHRLAVGHVRLGDMHAAMGDLASALDAYRAAEAIRLQLVEEEEDDAGWWREVATVLSRIGGAAAMTGDLEAARDAYERSLRIAEGLVLHEPGNDLFRRDFMAASSQIGGVYEALGRFGDALGAHETALDAALVLTGNGRSEDFGLLRELSVAHQKIGDARLATGALPEALAAYRAASAVAAGLVERDPQNASLLRDYSVTLDGIGYALNAAGDTEGALAAFGDGMEIALRLHELDPTNTGWKRDLNVGYGNLGNIHLENGDTDAAMDAFIKGVAIAEELTALDPANSLWKRDLAIGRNRVGDVHLQAGAFAEAERHYAEAMRLNRALSQADPGNVSLRIALVTSHYNLSLVGSDPVGDLQAALAILRDLEAAGTLPPRSEGWIAMLEEDLRRYEAAATPQ